MNIRNRNRKRGLKALLVGLVAFSVLGAFVFFMRDNSRRAMEISVESLRDSTALTAQRIEGILERSQNEINLLAALYAEILEDLQVNTEDLKSLADESSFEYVEFTDVNGVDLNAEGKTAEVSDRVYFQEGMKGNSGVDVLIGSRITNENLVVFYAPLYYEGEIAGVLTGAYTEAEMERILYNTFFDEDARTFLCLRDGTVIASCNGEYSPARIFENVSFNGGLSETVEAELEAALLAGTEYEFQYAGTGGTGNAYVIPLDYSEWILIQTFPSQVTAQFIQNANRAGMLLLAALVAIFGVCLITVWIATSVKNRRLEQENAEKTYVVDGIAHLFKRFVLVDVEQGAYRYLAGTKPSARGFPLQGSYKDLVEMIVERVDEEEERRHLREQLEETALRLNLSEDIPHLRYEYRNRCEQRRWDSLTLICLKRRDGVPTEVLFAYQDVTRVKERELRSYDALKEAYRAVESANQAKSNFLSNMSHDIRTPMNAIMGMTAIAAMNVRDPERVQDCLKKITVSSQHLLGLINEVLDMSKIESGKMVLAQEEFNLPDVVESVITMFLPQTQAKNQEFRVNSAFVTHERVIGDSMRLQQVLINILGNAVKFTPEGGKIAFSLCEKPSNAHGCGCYEFTVEDTGIGMEESYIGKLFEPFSRANNSRTGKVEGTGLGMSIVKNIVQMMNGEIQVESKLNVGSKFTVTVYLRADCIEEENAKELAHLTVLVADDDRLTCESACAMLREIGMQADWVLSGDEAIARLLEAREANREYAAVILDWKMPGKDGVQTAKAIRSRVGQEVPIIILSAYDYSAVEQEARGAGINAFISKPLFRSRLIYVLKSLVLGDEREQTRIDELRSREYAGKRVLVVEDNELNMEIAEELLTQAGVSVEKAVNGRLAVECVNRMPAGYYDLIFMDIQMPEMNGYEAAAAIRASEREDLRTLPIIAMSADAFMDDVKRAKEAGMNGHVAKPVEIEKLLKALEEWL